MNRPFVVLKVLILLRPYASYGATRTDDGDDCSGVNKKKLELHKGIIWRSVRAIFFDILKR